MGGMKLSISLPDELVAEIDRARGDVPRSLFIRRRLEVDWVRSLRVGSAPAELERSPKPSADAKPPREAKAERLEEARTIVQQPWGGVGGRPPVQKRGK